MADGLILMYSNSHEFAFLRWLINPAWKLQVFSTVKFCLANLNTYFFDLGLQLPFAPGVTPGVGS